MMSYESFMKENPTQISEVTNQLGQFIEIYENPWNPDAECWAVYKGGQVAASTNFFDQYDFEEDSDYNPIFICKAVETGKAVWEVHDYFEVEDLVQQIKEADKAIHEDSPDNRRRFLEEYKILIPFENNVRRLTSKTLEDVLSTNSGNSWEPDTFIGHAFTWGGTNEGHDFWHDIAKKYMNRLNVERFKSYHKGDIKKD